MLAETGDAAGAAALVEGVLAADPGHVAALKLDAKMAIDADRPETAVEDMRTALAQAPRDPEIMTIMALAHERQGSRELAGERLALAVEYSDKAPAESLRYARFLMQDEAHRPGRGGGGRRAPPRAGEPASFSTCSGGSTSPAATGPAPPRWPEILREQEDPAVPRHGHRARDREPRGPGPHRRDDRAPEGRRRRQRSGDARALAGLMQAYVAAGDLAAAEEHLDGILARDPKNVPARLMQGGLDALEGDAAAAEATYRAVIAETPAARAAYQALATLLAGQGKGAEAVAAVDQGLAALRGRRPAPLPQGRAPRVPGRHRRRHRALRGDLCRRQQLAGDRQQPREPHRQQPRRRGEPRARLRDRPPPARHRACPSSRTPTAGSCTAAATASRRSASSPPPPPRCPATRWCSSTSPRPSARSAASREARAAYERALLAAEAGSPLPQAAEARARIAEIDAAAAPAPEPAPAGTGHAG